MLVTYIDAPSVRPARMPSPFGEPHAVARRAAELLRRDLDDGLAARLGLAEDGKMFGVLVVEDRAGRVGFLRAFSGMVRGQWLLDGFVPPVFDLETRDAFWSRGECELAELGAQIAGLDARIQPIRGELDALIAAQQCERLASSCSRRSMLPRRSA
ncbi:MAG TPA: hypothetical protein VIV40_39915 [Kofleriaceae bacterium]